MFLPLNFQSKYGLSNELLMHFLVRERGPSDSLRGQEKWPQNAKSLLRMGALRNIFQGPKVTTFQPWAFMPSVSVITLIKIASSFRYVCVSNTA